MKPIWEIKPDGANVIATNSSTGEVFSGTRDQLNVKLASVHRDSYSRTLGPSDVARQLSSDASTAVVYTIPADNLFDGLSADSVLTAYQAGTGTVGFAAGPGVTLLGSATSASRYGSVDVKYIGANTWSAVAASTLPSIDTAGAGLLTAAPAFVRAIGASTTVAAAMEAFSAAMPKGGRTGTPVVVEQGGDQAGC